MGVIRRVSSTWARTDDVAFDLSKLTRIAIVLLQPPGGQRYDTLGVIDPQGVSFVFAHDVERSTAEIVVGDLTRDWEGPL